MSMMAYISAFASYLLVFVVFVVAVVGAVFLGIGVNKLINKNKMQEVQEDEPVVEDTAETV